MKFRETSNPNAEQDSIDSYEKLSN